LVELHGGTMEIASQPGQGTTVTARFPPMQA
jgi:signal transduction histidine kinase